MKTTATNRKLRMLLTGIRDGKLIPRPEFQRRLVWTNKDKRKLLDTVLKGFPFPEIYIAAGDVDPDTGEGTELLVDGQQRITTLNQYFTASTDLKLGKEIVPYAKLGQSEKLAFLEYEVVVRDLGKMPDAEIKEVFERINLTKYSLNDMEIHNARFAGAFKTFAEEVAKEPFFDQHRVFSANDIRRMGDTGYAITIIITIMSSYFNRDDEWETYLARYNDEFDQQEELLDQIRCTFNFIESCSFDSNCRSWKKSDLLTLVVEVHRAKYKKKLNLQSDQVGPRLRHFYSQVDNFIEDNLDPKTLGDVPAKSIHDYARCASQATNDRGSRIRRGEILQTVIEGAAKVAKQS